MRIVNYELCFYYYLRFIADNANILQKVKIFVEKIKLKSLYSHELYLLLVFSSGPKIA